MTWIIQNEKDELILKEIHTQTDRGAALIATAYMEERLLEAIKVRLKHHKTIENRLFKGLGPLASLSAKIDLGFLLGIFDEQSHRVLRTTKDIRNEFAHNPQPMDFKTEKISRLCARIDIAGEIDATVTTKDGQAQRIAFELKPDGTPKTAFLNAIRFLLLILDMETKIGLPREPAPPVLPPLGTRKASTGIP